MADTDQEHPRGDASEAGPKELRVVTFKTFLEEIPPGRKDVLVSDALVPYIGAGWYSLKSIDLDLYCPTLTKCEGTRSFQMVQTSNEAMAERGQYQTYVNFKCRNCQGGTKLYSLLVFMANGKCRMRKLGEDPEFGPPIPAKVITLIGPEREYYLRGRRCENQGLGIGAFGYYRRVVENQKNRIIDEIIRAAKQIAASPDMVERLEAAKKETQFSTAIDKIKPAVPQALLISGQNPLSLLHSALSQGLHAETDEECLELATGIRVVRPRKIEGVN